MIKHKNQMILKDLYIFLCLFRHPEGIFSTFFSIYIHDINIPTDFNGRFLFPLTSNWDTFSDIVTITQEITGNSLALSLLVATDSLLPFLQGIILTLVRSVNWIILLEVCSCLLALYIDGYTYSFLH